MQLVEQFISFLKEQKNQPSKLTVKNYKADINQFIRWFEERFKNSFDPNKATFQVVGLYKDSQSFSASSMERHLSSLRKFFNFLKLEGLISQSPFEMENGKWKMENADPYRLKDFKDFLYVYNASHLTIKNYIIDIKQFFKWAQEVSGIENAWDIREKNLLGKIDSSFIEEYKNRLLEQEFLPSTVNRKLSSLRKYFTWAQAEKIVSGIKYQVSSIADNKPAEIQAKYENLSIGKTAQIHNTKYIIQNTRYSPFPPIRLVQKFFNVFEFVFDYLVITPLTKLGETFEYVFWNIQGKPIFQNQKSKIKNQKYNEKLKIGNLRKEMFAPLSISTKSFPWHKKAWHHLRHTRPQWYRTYHSYQITHYFHLAILIIFMTAVGFALYNAFATTPQSQSPAFAAPVAPPRILSFQGRLTDSSDNPVTTAATAMRMAIYNDPTASGAALLWQEIVSVSPDTDGIFSILLGNNTAITQSIFAQNATLYLGVTVGSTAELTPRQQLATVAFATNAEVLQGLPPVTDAGVTTNTNAVLALNSSGTVSIAGTATTTFQAASGQLTITGKPLLLQTNSGTGGNITFAPDGLGTIDFQKPIQNSSNNNNISTAVGALEVNDLLAILATSSGQSALTINQTSTGPLISASTSGTAKFTVDNSGNGYFAGNVGIGITTPAAKLDISDNSANPALKVSQAGAGLSASFPSALDSASGLKIGTAADSTVLHYTAASTAAMDFNGLRVSNPGGYGAVRLDYLYVTSAIYGLTNGSALLIETRGAGDLDLSTETGKIDLQDATYNSTSNNGGTVYVNDTFATSGNVGVGTTAPGAALDIRGLSGTLPAATVSATSSFASLVVDNAGVGDLFTASKSGATKFVVTNAGNVGVGTNLPAATLDVVGTLKVSSTTNFGGIAYTWPGSQTTNYVLQTNGSGTLSWVDANAAAASTIYWNQGSGLLYPKNSTVDLTIGGQSTASAKFAFINVNSGNPTASISGNLSLAVPTTAGANTFNLLNNSTLNFQRSPGGDAGLATVMYIANNGNVGIGTTSPGAMLAVGSSTPALISSAGFITVANTTDSTSGSTGSINTLGGLGVTKDLAVDGGDIVTAATTFNLVNATATTLNIGGAATTLTMGATTGTASIRNATINFPNATAIGIGNTAPLTALDVTGSASLSANLSLRGAGTAHTFNILDNGTLNFQRSPSGDAGVSSVLFLNSNGNVGIGTTGPTAKLTVGTAFGGSMTAFGTTFVTNSGALGTTSGNSLTLANIGFTSGNNTALGIRAYRTANGSDWTTSSIVVGMDIDNTSNNKYLAINQTGIGIGTTTPSYALDVTGQVNATSGYLWGTAQNTLGTDQGGSFELGGTGSVANPVASGAPYIDFHFGTGSAQDYNFRLQNPANNRFDFVPSTGTPALSINSASVGIGTISPLSALDLRGNSGTTPIASFSGRTSFAGLVVDNGTLTTDLGDLITASSSAYPGQTPSGGGDTRTQFRVTNQGTIYGRAFYDIDNSAYFLDPASTGNALLVNGNVGIGITTPAAKLDISDNSANPALKVSQAGAGLSASFPSALDSASGLKIGTAADSTVLHYTTAGAASADFNGLRVSNPGGYGSVRLDYLYVATTIYGLTNGAAMSIETRGAGALSLKTETGAFNINSGRNTGNLVNVDNLAATAAVNASINRMAVENTNALTTAASGTHALITSLYVDEPNITIGTAGVTDAASLYVVAAPTEATNNYALWVDAGTSRFDGNVGFGGQTTPLTALDVTGSASLSANLSLRGAGTAHTFNILDNGTLNFQRSPSGDAGLAANSVLYLGSNGNVGMGTTSPGAKLQAISAAGASSWILNAQTSGLTNDSGIWQDASNNMQFAARDGSNVLRIVLDSNSSGNSYINAGSLGIGTTAPAAKLDVNGNATFNNNDLLNVSDIRGNNTNSYINFGDGGGYLDLYSTSRPIRLFPGNSQQTVQIGNVGSKLIVGNTVNDADPVNDIAVNGNQARAIGVERHTTANTAGVNLTVRSGGATSGATDKNGGDLYLASGISTGTGISNIYFQTFPAGSTGTSDNTATTRMIINSSGNVGIGTTSPLAALDVRGSSGTTPAASVSAQTSFAALITDNSGVGDLFTASKSGATKFVVTNAGNVGIGTNVPGAALSVSGGNNINERFPDGLIATAVNQSLTTDIDGISTASYTVTTGKTFYITSTYVVTSGCALQVGSKTYTTGTGIHSFGAPLLAGSAVVVSATGTSCTVNVNGFEVTAGVTAKNVTVSTDGADVQTTYTVTTNKTFYIANVLVSGTNSSFQIASKVYAAAGEKSFTSPLLAGSGVVLSCPATSSTCNVNGYETKSTGLGGADVAEQYFIVGGGDPGDVISMDSLSTSAFPAVSKTSKSYDQKVMGVITTNPGITLADDTTRNSDKPTVSVALNGRVPVKVSTENGPIKVGDPLTSSLTPGVAMKATKAGPIVAKALEQFNCPTQNNADQPSSAEQTQNVQQGSACTGKVLAFVNVSWYDPDVFITSTGNYSLASQGDALQTQTPAPFVLRDPFGNVIDRIGRFAEIAVANLKVGFINAQEITTNSLAVTADSVTIGGETLRDYILAVVKESGITNNESSIISPIVQTNQLATDIISPLSGGNIIVRLDNESRIMNQATDSGTIIPNSQFIIQDSSESAVAVIDNQGNASFAGQLTSNSLTTNSDATVGGTLRAKKIIADQIEGLNIQTSTLSAQYITNNYYDNFGLIADSASSSASQLSTFNPQLSTDFVNISSFSGQLAYVENLNAAFATFTQGVISLGPSSFTDLSVINQLSIGGNLILADASINVLGSDLKLQPLRQGGLSIMGDLVYIDTFGNIKVGGNAEFAKDVTIQGKLSANIISPIPSSDFVIQNSSDSALFTINSVGTATFSGQLNANQLTANKLSFGLVQPALAISNTELLATGSAGVATISAHQTEVTIKNNFVTDKSLIYITPVGQPSTNTPYLIRQVPSGPALSGVEGSFTAGIQSETNVGVPFNWLIIN